MGYFWLEWVKFDMQILQFPICFGYLRPKLVQNVQIFRKIAIGEADCGP